MVGHGGSSAGLYLADPTSPVPSHCASIAVTSTLRVKKILTLHYVAYAYMVFSDRCNVLQVLFWPLSLKSAERSAEWHCRCVTVIHATTVVCMSAWCGFLQGPWPFTHPGT